MARLLSPFPLPGLIVEDAHKLPCRLQKAAFLLFLGQQQSDPEGPCLDLFRVGVSGPCPGGLAVLWMRHGLENLLHFSPRT